MVVLLAGLPLAFTPPPAAIAPALLQALSSPAHVVYFAVLGAACLHASPRLRAARSLVRLSILLAIALVGGGAIEIMQTALGRTASLRDLYGDLLGVSLTALHAPARIGPSQLWSLRVAALGLLAWYLAPALVTLWNEASARIDFPLLADFDRPFEARRWSAGVADARHSRHGRRSLRLDLPAIRYPGTALRIFPRDWRGYDRLELSLHNPDDSPFDLFVKIYDQAHTERGFAYTDRFNRRVRLEHGWNEVCIALEDVAAAPRGRRLDLARIRALELFAERPPRSRTIYIDHVRLTRSTTPDDTDRGHPAAPDWPCGDDGR
jgi:hypothetical protein